MNTSKSEGKRFRQMEEDWLERLSRSFNNMEVALKPWWKDRVDSSKIQEITNKVLPERHLEILVAITEIMALNSINSKSGKNVETVTMDELLDNLIQKLLTISRLYKLNHWNDFYKDASGSWKSDMILEDVKYLHRRGYAYLSDGGNRIHITHSTTILMNRLYARA